MAFKFVVFAACLAFARAGVVPAAYGAPVAVAAPIAYEGAYEGDSYDPHPQYSYAYDVHDSITGDSKTQQETRDGDVVRGSYSLLEADGTRRVVEYAADAHSGFNAIVRKEPGIHAVAAAPVAHAVAAPVAHAVAAPIAHAAPVAYAGHAAAIAAPIAHAAPVAYASHTAAAIAAPISAGYAASPIAYGGAYGAGAYGGAAAIAAPIAAHGAYGHEAAYY